ncbi:hypothetical protein M5M_13435 [Simiduia agarivorans SA1 = DSM 21679]|uniref:Uncharacterized protein n=1 Tax=Simiduia agarivorans (strain DSM 21679 / JCM 13881 / BCRC 17597 / SA1) TaxID=1117647 RepID=K4KLD7_SIMAS|nr:hypothetical protein M5M_13435 [Simiduia agarivorans SA1 = DSM 21679]
MELTYAIMWAISMVLGILIVPLILEMVIKPKSQTRKSVIARVIFSSGVIFLVSNVATLILLLLEAVFEKVCNVPVADEIPCSEWIYHFASWAQEWAGYPFLLVFFGVYLVLMFRFGKNVGYNSKKI